MLTSYRRWIIDNNKDECVKLLREYVHREAEFHSVAFETIYGMGKRVYESASSIADSSHRTLFGNLKENQKQICCEICNQNRPIWKCFKFQNLTMKQRWQMIQKFNLCYCCLGKNHTVQSCRKIRLCGINGCPKFCNCLLHKSKEPRSDIQNTRIEKKSKQIEEQTAKISTCTSEKKEDQRTLIAQSSPLERVAMRTVPVLLANGKRKLQVNALLDDCSTKTYLNADVAAELELEGDVQCINVSVLNDENKQFETQPTDYET